MSKRLNIEELLSSGLIDTTVDLETALDNAAPSLMEYSIRSLIENEDDIYLNLQQVEKTYTVGDITIHRDYNDKYYVIDNLVKEEETASLF